MYVVNAMGEYIVNAMDWASDGSLFRKACIAAAAAAVLFTDMALHTEKSKRSEGAGLDVDFQTAGATGRME